MKTPAFFLAVLVGMVLSVPAYSQLTNMVLIEEATNASCPPCAAQNPSYNQFLDDNSSAVIGVSYHAWWPGSTDPMYTGNVTMNTNRINYYGFASIGVPVCVINGAFATPTGGDYQGAPGDIDALTNSVTADQAVTSPFSIWCDRYTQNDSEEVKVTLSSTTAITNDYLRVVVVEAEHDYTNAGDNGETKFFRVARKMLPTDKGTSFSLAANESKTFFFKYKYNPTAWTTGQLSIVAFVQSDKNKSVVAAVQTTEPPKSGFPTSSVPVVAESMGFSMHVMGSPNNQTVGYTLGGNNSLNVTFSVVDLLGREVQPSRSEIINPGTYMFDLHKTGLASGVYRVIARTPQALVQTPVIVEN